MRIPRESEQQRRMLKDGHRVVDGWCRNCGRTAGAILRVPFPAVFSWDRPRCDLSRLSFSDVIAGRQFARLSVNEGGVAPHVHNWGTDGKCLFPGCSYAVEGVAPVEPQESR